MSSTTPELSNVVVRAGAGAGKTTGLVERVVEVYKIYRSHGRVPRIVVTTFTRKATQELKERLIKYACKTEDGELLQFVTNPTQLQISTIHGLLSTFLRQVGHLADLDAGFSIVSETEGRKLGRLALRDTVLSHASGLKWLEIYGFKRLLAMLSAYDRAFKEQGSIKPASIEDITSYVKTVTEQMRTELLQFALSVLEELDDHKWTEFAIELKGFCETWDGNCSDLDKLPAKPRNSKKQEHLQAWHERAEILKTIKSQAEKIGLSQDLWPQMVEEWKAFLPFAKEFSEKLASLKEGRACLEMIDLELRTIEVLRSKPFLAQVFSENWDYWMIDEYQDTSPLQVACLKALIGKSPRYYVGDPQQSIYLFRGAEVSVFDQAVAEVKESNGVLTELKRNYRSRPDLLLWINEFMASIGPHFQRMEPKEQPSSSSSEAVVKMFRAKDEEAEILAVAERVGALVAAGASLEQICILGRTHRVLMDVSRVLRDRGFSTHVYSARGFRGRREVIDAQALWKFLLNPHDNLNLLILLRSPWFYVPDHTLSQWMDSKPDSLWESLTNISGQPSLSLLKEARLLCDRVGLVAGFEQMLCKSGIIDLSLHNDLAGRKESNLWKLIAKAHDLEENGETLLSLVDSDVGVDLLDSNEGDATSAQEPNSISLMTIHGSKGLEFEHVIVVRMGESPRTSITSSFSYDEGRFFFPIWSDSRSEFSSSPLDDFKVKKDRARELEEFDRWLYVALTRAKNSLTLTWSGVNKDSWASRSSWFSLPAGTHNHNLFTFEVYDIDELALHEYSRPLADASQVRLPWQKIKISAVGRQSVTDLIQDTDIPATKQMLLNGWLAQSKGTYIHQILQALKYNNSLNSKDPSVQFVLSITEPPMARLVESGEVEWGFQVKTPTQVVEGQIDLWGRHDGKIYVIDYKTGSNKYKDLAFAQLGLYAWALRKFGYSEPVEMVVIYPLEAQVERRIFTDELFCSWELKFSSAQT